MCPVAHAEVTLVHDLPAVKHFGTFYRKGVRRVTERAP
jgi:hypothetical protein